MRIRMLTALIAAAWLAVAPGAGASPDDGGSGYLGVRLQRVEGGLAEALDVDEDGGVLLGEVLDDGPAAESGLHAGDIIVRVDGEKVGTPRALRDVIQDHAPGTTVKIAYLRDGDEREAKVELGEAPKDSYRVRRIGRGPDHTVKELKLRRDRGFLGVVTQPLSGDLGEYFGVEDGEGALVSEVLEDSPAAALGLKVGDVIVRVDDETIDDPEDLRDTIGDYEEETEVEIAWVRDREKRDGKTTLEIRESRAPRMFSRHRWHDGDGEIFDFDIDEIGDIDLGEHLRDLRQHVGSGVERLREIRIVDDDLEQELDDLRAEIEILKGEIQSLKGADREE
jgi:C-terminal processing protease CtpA/Prc